MNIANSDMDNDFNSFIPNVCVIGVGGAGCNAVNGMCASLDSNIKFIAANTDAQCMKNSIAPHKIQLGKKLTRGLGAGANPEIGRASAEESLEEIENLISGADLLFITAGMGGGTGTGAAPVVAKLAKEMGILTVGVVTQPFTFEGNKRLMIAQRGTEEAAKYLDTIIVVSNQNLFRIANEKTSLGDAFKATDGVLKSSIQCVADLLFKPGFVNLDFADMRTVIKDQGRGMISYGEAFGENRGIIATEISISNPLINESDLSSCKNMLINITGGDDMTLFETDEVVQRIKNETKGEVELFFGSVFDKEMTGRIRVSIIATGVSNQYEKQKSMKSDVNIKTEKATFNEPTFDFADVDTNNLKAFEEDAILDTATDHLTQSSILQKMRNKFRKQEESSDDSKFVVSFDEE